jgi:hypothetical protein
MYKMMCFAVLLVASSIAQSAEEFTPLEMKAWRNTCAETINGDAALCSCVHTLQVKDLGVKTVKIFYLSMAMMEPEPSSDELTEASDALDKLTNGNDSKMEKAMDDFSSTLMDNTATCSG